MGLSYQLGLRGELSNKFLHPSVYLNDAKIIQSFNVTSYNHMIMIHALIIMSTSHKAVENPIQYALFYHTNVVESNKPSEIRQNEIYPDTIVNANTCLSNFLSITSLVQVSSIKTFFISNRYPRI